MIISKTYLNINFIIIKTPNPKRSKHPPISINNAKEFAKYMDNASQCLLIEKTDNISTITKNMIPYLRNLFKIIIFTPYHLLGRRNFI